MMLCCFIVCAARRPPAERRGEEAPLLLFKQPQDGHPVRGLAVDLQSQSTASPPGYPCEPCLGGRFPSTRVHGRYAAKRTGSYPVRRLNGWLSALRAEVP